MRHFPQPAMHRAGIRCCLAALACIALTGCHSHYVAMDVRNDSGAAISLLEVDYPSASFGVDRLAAGATYHYRFKILGDGSAKLLWTDAQQRDHTVVGPTLHEGQEGRLTATIADSSAAWASELKP